jgi:hypothetical protein
MNEDTNEDLQPLFGALGPYIADTTGPSNPYEEFADDAEEYYDPEALAYEDDTDYWEDEEQ